VRETVAAAASFRPRPLMTSPHPTYKPLTSAYVPLRTEPGCPHPRLQAHRELKRATDWNASSHGLERV